MMLETSDITRVSVRLRCSSDLSDPYTCLLQSILCHAACGRQSIKAMLQTVLKYLRKYL